MGTTDEAANISLLNICDNPRVAKIGIQSSKMTCMELTALNLLYPGI